MSVVAAAAPVVAFEVDVLAVRRLSPSFLRVTLGGPALHGFDGCGALGPRDLRVKLMLPSPGRPLPDLSDLSPGWYRRWLVLDRAIRGTMRTYTVRSLRLDGEIPELDIDFVVHGDGPGSSWAGAIRPGDRATVLGPNAAAGGYGGIEWRPPSASAERPVRVLLAGDETAAPAISAVLESLPSGYHGHAVVEVPQAEDFLDVQTRSGVEVCWVARGARAHGERLAEAVKKVAGPRRAPTPQVDPTELPDLDIDTHLLWESTAAGAAGGADFYAWIAGEAAVVRGLRRYLVRELGIDRRIVAFMGYWRQGKPELG